MLWIYAVNGLVKKMKEGADMVATYANDVSVMAGGKRLARLKVCQKIQNFSLDRIKGEIPPYNSSLALNT